MSCGVLFRFRVATRFDRANQRVEAVAIEPDVAIAFHDAQRSFFGQCGAMRPIGRQRLVRVGDREDSGTERQLTGA